MSWQDNREGLARALGSDSPETHMYLLLYDTQFTGYTVWYDSRIMVLGLIFITIFITSYEMALLSFIFMKMGIYDNPYIWQNSFKIKWVWNYFVWLTDSWPFDYVSNQSLWNNRSFRVQTLFCVALHTFKYYYIIS